MIETSTSGEVVNPPAPKPAAPSQTPAPSTGKPQSNHANAAWGGTVKK